MSKIKRKKHWGHGWAWMLEDGTLCNYARPFSDELKDHVKPSTDARKVRVQIVPSIETRR